MKKLFIVLIFFISLFALKNNCVFGYGLKLKANYDYNSSENDHGYLPLRVENTVASVDIGIDSKNDPNYKNDPANYGWAPASLGTTSSTQSFSTCDFIFYSMDSYPLTNYSSSDSKVVNLAYKTDVEGTDCTNGTVGLSVGKISDGKNPDYDSVYANNKILSFKEGLDPSSNGDYTSRTVDYLTNSRYVITPKAIYHLSVSQLNNNKDTNIGFDVGFSNVLCLGFGNRDKLNFDKSNSMLDNTYMPTLWQYYGVTRSSTLWEKEVTTGYPKYNHVSGGHDFWNRDRGYSDGSSEASPKDNYISDDKVYSDQPSFKYSVANLYDNILSIPNNPGNRKVYIRYIYRDATNNSLNTIPDDVLGTHRASDSNYEGTGSDIGGYSPNSFTSHEYYKYTIKDSPQFTRYDANTLNGRKIQYVGYKKVTQPTQMEAQSILATLPGYNSGETVVNIGTSSTSDVTFIDFYYELLPPTPAATLNGRLGFTTTDSSYTAAKTTSTTEQTQYIPSGKTVKPYVSDAYPYLLDNIRYSREYSKQSVNGKDVTVVYYKIFNVDLWTIDYATLHDSYDNTGGLLFGNNNSDYKLSTSQSYKDRVKIDISPPEVKVSGNSIKVTNGGVKI